MMTRIGASALSLAVMLWGGGVCRLNAAAEEPSASGTAIQGDNIEQVAEEGVAEETRNVRPAEVKAEAPVEVEAPAEVPAEVKAEVPAEAKVAGSQVQGDIADLLMALQQKEADLKKSREEIARLKDIVRKIADANRSEQTAMHYNMACSYRSSGEFRKAETEFLEALRINPHDPATHYNLGILYDDDLKDSKKARQHYERFLALSPAGTDAAKVREWLRSLQ